MTDYKKEEIIGIEKLTLCEWHTFNLNPDDSRQYWDNNSVLNRIDSMESYVEKYLIPELKKYAMVEMYMEVSPKGRLHFHGVIMFTTNTYLRLFYLDYIHNILTKFTMTMGKITDKQIWYDYITKQQNILKGKILPYKTNDLNKITNIELSEHLHKYNPVYFAKYPLVLATLEEVAPPQGYALKDKLKKKNKRKAV